MKGVVALLIPNANFELELAAVRHGHSPRANTQVKGVFMIIGGSERPKWQHGF